MTTFRSDQQDLFAARRARDDALERVESHSLPYAEMALEIIRRLPSGLTVIGEDVRLRVEKMLGEPHHHNVWGSIIMKAKRRGYLIPTGRMSNAKTVASHCRPTQVYITQGWEAP